ncbi:hypothetical protein ACJX0J_025683, partial [Zea mays]
PMHYLEEVMQIHFCHAIEIFHEQGFIFYMFQFNDISFLDLWQREITLTLVTDSLSMEDKNFFESLLSSMKWASAEVAGKGTRGEFHLILDSSYENMPINRSIQRTKK